MLLRTIASIVLTSLALSGQADDTETAGVAAAVPQVAPAVEAAGAGQAASEADFAGGQLLISISEQAEGRLNQQLEKKLSDQAAGLITVERQFVSAH
ncbi:MAG: hypothetical protein AAGA91_03560 [Pseudomonadota bacterium]